MKVVGRIHVVTQEFTTVEYTTLGGAVMTLELFNEYLDFTPKVGDAVVVDIDIKVEYFDNLTDNKE